jgi:hypothetical protein
MKAKEETAHDLAVQYLVKTCPKDVTETTFVDKYQESYKQILKRLNDADGPEQEATARIGKRNF